MPKIIYEQLLNNTTYRSEKGENNTSFLEIVEFLRNRQEFI